MVMFNGVFSKNVDSLIFIFSSFQRLQFQGLRCNACGWTSVNSSLSCENEPFFFQILIFACLALPCLALPCLALPCLALLCFALLWLACLLLCLFGWSVGWLVGCLVGGIGTDLQEFWSGILYLSPRWALLRDYVALGDFLSKSYFV